MIADKIQNYLEKASWIRKMFEEGTALRKIHGEKNVFDFTLGNPAVEPPEAFRRELRRLAEDQEQGMHRYMSNAGYEETRGAVAEVLSERSSKKVSAQHVVMTCGAGGALNVVLKTILNPEEEVIILSPFFVEYRFYIDNHGGVSRVVNTDMETFQPDLAAIEEAINTQTRAIIINSPNNPTGVIYPRETLEKLGALVARKEKELGKTIFVISDEPYAGIAYDKREVPSLFDCVRNAIIVTSHSKDLALPGERIGYLAASPDMNGVGKFLEGAVFCNRILGFVNAPALIQRLVTGLQHESVDIAEYQEKRDLLYNKLTAIGFRMIKPDGAFYLFPQSPLEDDVEFVRVAQKHRILVVPGAGFGAPGFFRIAYCMEKEMIERSLPAWEELARELKLI
jgi:aspartate aminotransferase